MRWHNGRTRRSPNPNPEEVLRDCVTNGERSAAHSILARSLGSNKGRIHLRRPTRQSHFSLATRRRTIHSELAHHPTARSAKGATMEQFLTFWCPISLMAHRQICEGAALATAARLAFVVFTFALVQVRRHLLRHRADSVGDQNSDSSGKLRDLQRIQNSSGSTSRCGAVAPAALSSSIIL